MTLATRLSAFFLAALATVLAAMSVSVYVFSREDAYMHLDERLDSALDTLEASVDVETGGLEWEPEDRRITLGLEDGPEHIRWSITGPRGEPVDRSANAISADFPPASLGPLAGPEPEGDATAFASHAGWRLAVRHLRLAELLRAGRGHPDDDLPDDDIEYPELTLVAGLSPAPTRASLGRLALALSAISALTWLACALLGRRLIRRALSPVRRMAEAARRIDPADPGWSLPEPGSRDELAELAASYNGLLARLRDAYDTQRRFAGEASHQLRTPLAGLLSQLDVALRRDRSPDEYRRVLGVARDEAAHLRRIIESLLFLSRPDALDASRAFTAIDLAEWLPSRLRRWDDHPRAADLSTSTGPGPLVVRAHAELLGQLLGNLVDNALAYSDPGSPVVVSARIDGGRVSIAVEDRGHGLAPDDLRHVFDPFYRSESARRSGRSGTGLGLAVAQRIADALGGSLDAQSELGRGSRFTLRLPLTDQPAPALTAP